eukprot:COSAG02_NODE_11949_length_1626_cov_1.679764_1_plen_119_part_00
MHGRTSVLAVLPLPRHGELAAADLAASHRALEGARTYAPGISSGAVAVYCAFQRAQARHQRDRRSRTGGESRGPRAWRRPGGTVAWPARPAAPSRARRHRALALRACACRRGAGRLAY